MSTEYGKDLLIDRAAFARWIEKTTLEICNLNCEDEREIAESLKGAPPNAFPCVMVWCYKRHFLFAEPVYLSDFPVTSTDNSKSPDSEKGKGGAK